MLKWTKYVLLGLTLSATAAYAALPGAHRALTPAAFGLTAIENGFYTDAPERSDEFIALYNAASARSEAFHGPLTRAPRIVFCTTSACKDVFDLKPRGLTFGAHVIFLGPLGVNEMILTHELSHIQLHSQFGLRDLVRQRVPAWFNEGLAMHLSADARARDFSPAGAKWVRAAQGYRDWGRLHKDRVWQDTYGAAKSLVADLQKKIGDDGLRRVIARTFETHDFQAALAEEVGPDWP